MQSITKQIINLSEGINQNLIITIFPVSHEKNKKNIVTFAHHLLLLDTPHSTFNQTLIDDCPSKGNKKNERQSIECDFPHFMAKLSQIHDHFHFSDIQFSFFLNSKKCRKNVREENKRIFFYFFSFKIQFFFLLRTSRLKKLLSSDG